MKFEYVTPESTGIKSEYIYQMLQELDEHAELHSIVILNKGKLIAGGSWAPFTLEDPQMMHSLSKIGVSICIGFAIEDGKLHLEDRFIEYVRDELPDQYDPSLETITIYDLLTMQAGSPQCCNNVYFTSLNNAWQTHWLKEKKLSSDIGNKFHYDSGCSYTLSRIISKIMGATCLELLQAKVFSRLNLDNVNWLVSPEGHNTGGWGMYLTAPQIAAIGQLLIQSGNWQGQQLISESWIHEMTKGRVAIPDAADSALNSYAYHIKSGPHIYAAEGAFGQFMLCFRDYPIVIALTAGTSCTTIADICQNYILKALRKSPDSNTAGSNFDNNKLHLKLQSLNLPMAKGNFSEWNDSDSIFDRWIQLEQNPRGLVKIRFKKMGKGLLDIQFETCEVQKHCSAGFKSWLRNDLYPDDYTKQYHCLSYGFDEKKLYVMACLINTSYCEEYCFDFNGDNVLCSWKPNVTYLDNNDNRVREFKGVILP